MSLIDKIAMTTIMKNYPFRSDSLFLLMALLSIAMLWHPIYAQTNNRLLDSLKIERLSEHIRKLQTVGGTWSRVTFTAGNDSGVQYIKKAFDKISGLSSVVLDTFYVANASAPYNTKPLFNVIATLKGKTDTSKVFVLGAHHDCSGSRTVGNVWNSQWKTLKIPGADDNASGVASILEIARVLADTSLGFKNDYTIKFIAFGAEESSPAASGSHFGSIYYATKAKARGENIIGMVSLDMIGYNKVYNFVSVIYDAASAVLATRFVNARDSAQISLISTGLLTTSSGANYSDHLSFWQQGYPAICLIEYAPPWNNGPYYIANPFYHTPNDTFETVNMELVKRVAQATAAMTMSVTEIVTSTPRDGYAELPASPVLQQNYPNPFNPSTTIRFQIPAAQTVSLRIYDMLGREVATLCDERMEAGDYSASFNARGLATGVYIYTLKTETSVLSKKFVLLK
jgi:hypothetical protein